MIAPLSPPAQSGAAARERAARAAVTPQTPLQADCLASGEPSSTSVASRAALLMQLAGGAPPPVPFHLPPLPVPPPLPPPPPPLPPPPPPPPQAAAAPPRALAEQAETPYAADDDFFPPSLRTHGRFSFSAINERPPAPLWPGGRRLAVYVAVNLEHFAFGEGLGAEIAPSAGGPDVLNYSWREWGNRVGAFRLLDTLAELGLPCAALLNSALVEHAPGLVLSYLHHVPGCELVAHGRSNSERQGVMTEADEAAMITECSEVLSQLRPAPGFGATAASDSQGGGEGAAELPLGWLSPWISESDVTPDLLTEAGYGYTLNWCHDDAPTWMMTRSGVPLLSVPYPQDGLNDIPAIVVRRESPAQFADALCDAFDELYRAAVSAPSGPPLVMGIALHPYIIAQPHRLGHLRRALRHVSRPRPGVWLTTPGAIAAHYAAHCSIDQGDGVG